MSSQRFSNASYGNQQRRTEAGAKNVIAGFINEVNDPTGTTSMLFASNREVLTSPNTSFSDLGGGSVDTVFSPFQINGGSSKLPTYPASASSTCVPAQSNHVDPPVDQWTSPTVNSQYLNPFKRAADPQHSDTASDTYDGQIIFNGSTSVTQNLVSKVHLQGGSFPTDLRPVAIRGPVVIQGWGYDLNGKPIPNKIDSVSNARGGTFQDTGLKDKFLDNHMLKRETWPVAPLDVRYDRKRKVWTVPQTFRMIIGQAPTGIMRGSSASNIQPQNIDTVYDANGNTIPSFSITLPEGNWNAIELANYITNEINTTAGVPNLMSMVYDTISLKFKFVCNVNNNRITLATQYGVESGIDGNDMNEELGFDLNTPSGDCFFERDGVGNYRAGFTDPPPVLPGIGIDTITIPSTPIQTFIFADDAADMTNSIRTLFLRSNLTTSSILDSFVGGGFSNIMSRIPINAEPGGIISLSATDGDVHKLLIKVKDITAIHLRLTNQRNQPIDLNGLNFDVAIKLDFIENQRLAEPENIREILVDWGLFFNSTVREFELDNGIISWIDVYSRSEGSGLEGVYYYNFCLNSSPFLYQPSGAVNLSAFSTINWKFKLKPSAKKMSPPSLIKLFWEPQQIVASVNCDPLTNNSEEPITTRINKTELYLWSFTLHIMEERYNIVEFIGGNVGLAFSN